MKNYKHLVDDFKKVAQLAGIKMSDKDIVLEIEESPLPSGKMAVYVFMWGDDCLKVGKVGPRSQARYTSHHYNPNSSNSNLAKSILKHKNELGLTNLTESTIGNWIKSNTDRINFILNKELGIPVLTLLEAFLQCRLRPKFEGFDSQR